jgi:hypothetical protein
MVRCLTSYLPVVYKQPVSSIMVRNNNTVNHHTYLERLTRTGTTACVKRDFERVNPEIMFIMGRITNLNKLAVGYNVPLIQRYVKGEENYIVFSSLDRPNQPALIKGLTSKDPKMNTRQIKTKFRIPRPRKLVGVRRFHSTSFISGKETSLETLWKSKLSGFEGNKELENLVKSAINNKKCNYLTTIMSEPDFLIKCLQRIESKNGNDAKAFKKTALKENDVKWFENTANTFRNGLYKFDESRISVSKRNKSKAFQPFTMVEALKDEIIQEAMGFLLDLIFEPTFRASSHRSKSNKGCFTALNSIRMHYGNVSWFIRGSIDSQFPSINHSILVKVISEKIEDQAFLDLIYKYVKFECREVKKASEFIEGCDAQKGFLPSILYNIYMSPFDTWVEDILIPSFNCKYRLNEDLRSIKMRRGNPHTQFEINPDLRRLKYTRCDDDFIIGFIGSREECLTIRTKINNFLTDNLKLNLNIEKMKITHALSDFTNFLEYNVYLTQVNKAHTRSSLKGRMRKVVPHPILYAPTDKKVNELFINKFATKDGNPTKNGRFIHLNLVDIVNHYKNIEKGILNYYAIANNFKRFSAKIHYILKYSCALTIASKMKLNTLRKVFSKYGRNLTVINKEKTIYTDYPTPSYKKKSTIYLPRGCSPENIITNLSKRINREKRTC